MDKNRGTQEKHETWPVHSWWTPNPASNAPKLHYVYLVIFFQRPCLCMALGMVFIRKDSCSCFHIINECQIKKNVIYLFFSGTCTCVHMCTEIQGSNSSRPKLPGIISIFFSFRKDENWCWRF